MAGKSLTSPRNTGAFSFQVAALLLAFALLMSGRTTLAQEAPCPVESVAREQEILASYLPLDFASDFDAALANLFRLGALYQELALRCGYQPNEPEIDAMLERALDWASLEDLLAAGAVGDDVDAIMLKLDEVYGDPFRGQALYNGSEGALGGIALGCAGCHENEASAPLTAGTWTRADDIRLGLPAFEGYTVRKYLVESIIQPGAYLAPDYADLMPAFYGSQLTIEQLADLVAYLESQDQLLDD